MTAERSPLDEIRDRAVAFVAERGDAAARARGAAVMGEGDVADALAFLAAPEPGARLVPAALELFAVLDDLHSLKGPIAERTAARIRAVQDADGGWPHPDDPSDAGRLVATGALAGYLAQTGRASAETLDAAGALLTRAFTPDLFQTGSIDAIASYAHAFSTYPHEEADAVLQWTGRELEKGFRQGAFDAVQTARVFVRCGARALPGARLDHEELSVRIAREQQADGGWLLLADPSPAARVAHTLDALVAFERFVGAPVSRPVADVEACC